MTKINGKIYDQLALIKLTNGCYNTVMPSLNAFKSLCEPLIIVVQLGRPISTVIEGSIVPSWR